MRWHGHARVSARNFEPSGVCDSCGIRYTKSDLRWQFQWEGNALINQRFLHCPTCLDPPDNRFRAIRIPPDPVPVPDARPTLYATQQYTFRQTEDGRPRVFEGNLGIFRVMEGDGSNWIIRTDQAGKTRITQDGTTRVAEQPFTSSF